MTAPNFRSFEVVLLALCAWREARNEGDGGMRAVMHVIRNRVLAAGKENWADIITSRNQFTSISYKGDSQTVAWPKPGDERFSIALIMADLVINLGDKDCTGGALYYANLKTMDKDGWFERNIVHKPEEHKQTAAIGAHTFFS